MTPAIEALIVQIATEETLPVDLLRAQVLVESSGQSDAFRFEPAYYQQYIKGHPAKGLAYGPLAACSYGLLQILLETAIEQGFTGRPEQLFDPEIGLRVGAAELVRLWTLVGKTPESYRHALALYNGGQSLRVVPESIWPSAVVRYVTAICGSEPPRA